MYYLCYSLWLSVLRVSHFQDCLLAASSPELSHNPPHLPYEACLLSYSIAGFMASREESPLSKQF